jgi:hydroxymethylpyrimidine pyrophosphatase-like HAD family hydrolase
MSFSKLPLKLPPQKIIAFDLDGTLTVSKTSITEEMASLVRELMKHKMVEK